MYLGIFCFLHQFFIPVCTCNLILRAPVSLFSFLFRRLDTVRGWARSQPCSSCTWTRKMPSGPWSSCSQAPNTPCTVWGPWGWSSATNPGGRDRQVRTVRLGVMLGGVKYSNLSRGVFNSLVFIINLLFNSSSLNFSKLFCSHLYSFVFTTTYTIDVLKFFPYLPWLGETRFGRI